MKTKQYFEEKHIPIQVYGVYFILLLPISLILLINKLLSPLAPTVSFIDLDEMVSHKPN